MVVYVVVDVMVDVSVSVEVTVCVLLVVCEVVVAVDVVTVFVDEVLDVWVRDDVDVVVVVVEGHPRPS